MAQSKTVLGVFPTIDHSAAVAKKLDYSVYYFAAFPLLNTVKPDFSTDAFFHLLYAEQTLNYHVTSKLDVAAAYVFQRENVRKPYYSNENRIHFQAKYKAALNKITVSQRLRFDARFTKNSSVTKSMFTHRIRYLVGLDASLSEKFYVAAYEEVFFNTHKSASAVYGENWAYAGVGKKINSKHKLEAGLLYITWNIGPKAWFHQYYLQFTWLSHFDLRKK
jgi:hypothetical protein